MRYRVIIYDDTNTPFPIEKTYFYCDSLGEAKLKKEELEKEHSNMYGELNPWFRFEIQEGHEKTYIRINWKEVLL